MRAGKEDTRVLLVPPPHNWEENVSPGTVVVAGGWDGPALPAKAELGVAPRRMETSPGYLGWLTFLRLIYSTGDNHPVV